MAEWHVGVAGNLSQEVRPVARVQFAREVARFGKRLPKWFIRTAYAFFDDQVGDADLAAAASDFTQWGPRVAHCWARLMAAMPEAVTPDPEVLGDLSLPYLRTAGDHD